MNSKKLGLFLLVMFNYASAIEQIGSTNSSVVNNNVLEARATILTSVNNINDLKKLISNTYDVNLIIEGRVLDGKRVYIDRNNLSLKDLLDYVKPYYKYTWYIENDNIILNTGVVNPKGLDKVNKTWRITTSDRNLRNVLNKWCVDNGWSLIWNAKYNYLIDANWEINGDFEYAINQVLKATNSSEKNLFAKMYIDNKVLVIDSR